MCDNQHSTVEIQFILKHHLVSSLLTYNCLPHALQYPPPSWWRQVLRWFRKHLISRPFILQVTHAALKTSRSKLTTYIRWMSRRSWYHLQAWEVRPLFCTIAWFSLSWHLYSSRSLNLILEIIFLQWLRNPKTEKKMRPVPCNVLQQLDVVRTLRAVPVISRYLNSLSGSADSRDFLCVQSKCWRRPYEKRDPLCCTLRQRFISFRADMLCLMRFRAALSYPTLLRSLVWMDLSNWS